MGKESRWARALFAAWIVALGFGLVMLWRYKLGPGESGRELQVWPADSSLPRATGGPSVVMFAHPQCPCTLAALDELDRAIAATGARVGPVIAFAVPVGASDERARGAAWDRASRIPGAQVLLDRGGREAERFGATTSGHVFVFGVDGHRRFVGGVTPARGHVGDGPGRQQLIVALSGRPEAGLRAPPVFGCSLEERP